MDARLKYLICDPLQKIVCQSLTQGIPEEFTKQRFLTPLSDVWARCCCNYFPTHVKFSLGKYLQFLRAASVLQILPPCALGRRANYKMRILNIRDLRHAVL